MEGSYEDMAEGPDLDPGNGGTGEGREGTKVTLGKMLASDDLVNYHYKLSRGRNFHRTWLRMRLQ